MMKILQLQGFDKMQKCLKALPEFFQIGVLTIFAFKYLRDLRTLKICAQTICNVKRFEKRLTNTSQIVAFR